MKRFINWCRRYISIFFVAIVAAVAYILFFNENSVSHQAELKAEIRRLQYEIKDCNDTIERYRELNRRLQVSPEEMERIVREQYHMQRPNEDVYIME